jgi:hypothetical protein
MVRAKEMAMSVMPRAAVIAAAANILRPFLADTRISKELIIFSGEKSRESGW